MELVGRKDTDIGGAHPNRTCTTAGVQNPEYPTPLCGGGSNAGKTCSTDADCSGGTCIPLTGCLFGPPLPIPNNPFPALSTCVINRVAKSAAGTAACDTGGNSVAEN